MARPITDAAIGWLRERRDRPFLLFLHYFDVHGDYRSLPRYEGLFVSATHSRFDGSTEQMVAANQGSMTAEPADGEHLARLYDAGIRQLDEELGRLVAFLRDEGWLSGTHLIVTSDHGEEFQEHGRFGHSMTHCRVAPQGPALDPEMREHLRRLEYSE